MASLCLALHLLAQLCLLIGRENAAILNTSQKDVLILDIGITTSNVEVLVNGFPRESSKSVTVEGIQTNFCMPDIYSIDLGGEIIFHEQPDCWS